MYIVRDKKTKAIIHINPAPLSQELDGSDVYYKYNSRTMEIGKTDLAVLPEHFKIDAERNIVELTPEELVSEGFLTLEPSQKIENGQIVEKTIDEKIQEGLLTLAPTQKIAGSGAEAKIVDKTPSELLAEQIIELHPTQKIVDSGSNEQIVAKSQLELLQEGLLTLGPNQKLEGDKIVTYTNEEMYEKGYITLDQYKSRKMEGFHKQSFDLMEVIIPHYKLLNAGLSLYSEEENNSIKATIQAFREEYYNLKQQMDAAPDIQAAMAIKENYPREKVVVRT